MLGSKNGIDAAEDATADARAAIMLALALAPPSMTTDAFENDAFCGDDDEALVDLEGRKGRSAPNAGGC